MIERIRLGPWTEERLTDLLRKASEVSEPGERIAYLSRHFLNAKYVESTLMGDIHTPEVFVINLEGVDCFTYIEYIESMRRARTYDDFKEQLRKVRYRSGSLSYENRNHFFTDWKAWNAEFITDVTRYAGTDRIKEVSKRLNEKHDGTPFLPGIACRLRELAYIPSIHVDNAVLDKLWTGDYVGIYTKQEGLDVSHVGILIRGKDDVTLRHASSLRKRRKVIDEGLRDYLKAKPGIVVFRPRD